MKTVHAVCTDSTDRLYCLYCASLKPRSVQRMVAHIPRDWQPKCYTKARPGAQRVNPLTAKVGLTVLQKDDADSTDDPLGYQWGGGRTISTGYLLPPKPPSPFVNFGILGIFFDFVVHVRRSISQEIR